MNSCSLCSRRFPPPLSSLYSRRCRCTVFAFGLVLRHHGLPWAGSCTPLVPVLRHHGLPSGWCLSPRVALGWCLHPPCAGACHHGLPSGWLPWADACHPPCAGILPRVAFGPGCLRAVLPSGCITLVLSIVTHVFRRGGAKWTDTVHTVIGIRGRPSGVSLRIS